MLIRCTKYFLPGLSYHCWESIELYISEVLEWMKVPIKEEQYVFSRPRKSEM